MAGPGTPKRPALIGCGLLGSNMLVLLTNSPGCEFVTVVDRCPPNQAFLAASGLPDSKIRFHKHALGSDGEDNLKSALENVDCAFFMVTPHVQFAPEQAFYNCNVTGIKHLLGACRAKNVKRVVYLSSVAVTNNFVDSVHQTEDDPLPPLEEYESPYDITKRMGEELCLHASCDDLRICALRPAGIMLSPHDFIFDNLFRVPRILPMPYGFKQLDFMDGRDVCRAALLAAQKLEESPSGVAGEAFFITKGETFRTLDLSVLAREHVGGLLLPVPLAVTRVVIFAVRVHHLLRKALGLQVPGVPPHRFMWQVAYAQEFDNSKAERALGFQSKVPIAEAVARICEVYQQERALAPSSLGLRFCLCICAGIGGAAVVAAASRRHDMSLLIP